MASGAKGRRGRVTDKYVALIRGINVGRAKRVAMAELRALLARLGYVDVRTILNSGNLVFSGTRQQPMRIGKRIEDAMSERFGVSGRVTVLTASEFARVVEENALAEVATDPSRLLVAFCSDAGRLKQLEALKRQEWAPEAVASGSLAAYVWCAEGILASRLLGAVGRALGESTTTRNWSTVGRIQAVLEPEAAGITTTLARRPASRKR
jgi:uncharacterized protein (DUF1697 family)